MTKTSLIVLMILVSIVLNAQNRNGNTINAEIFADAPYRMKVSDAEGNIQAIPVHMHVHDGDGLGSNVELMSIDIRIKNASDTAFGPILVFDTLSEGDFNHLLIHRSVNNDDLDVYDFNSSQYEKSSEHSIIFKKTYDFIDGEYYVSIDRRFWYFTFLIPPEVLVGYENIIDIMVYFNIDWSTDDETGLRIFREEQDLPQLDNWYRGDCHYHTIFTQNLVELGEPLDATKLAGQLIGLDWQFTTDHSCDFDNYGVSINDNWDILGNTVHALNLQDPNYIFIRGVEMSVDNSDGKIVHALSFPRESSLFSLPFLGDGDGDAVGTDVSIQNLIDGLIENNGFCYAAHPFSEGDKLPDLISGGAWNINDNAFPENDEAHPSNGTVICNNFDNDSDIYSDDPEYLFKKALRGFQIWNMYNTLVTNDNDNFDDAWNVHYNDDNDYFAPIDENEILNMMYRLQQGLDVYKFLLQKGLIEKNANSELKNWKTYMLAGSDAHGSFNFSNTNMAYAFLGDIEINALGKINTLAYCPDGMGAQGEHIVTAVYNGNTILSDGPIISISLVDNFGNEIIIGEDTCISEEAFNSLNLDVNIVLSNEFGAADYATLYIGTENQEYSVDLQTVLGSTNYNLSDLINNQLGSIPFDHYFYLRAELQTEKQYGENSTVYLTESQTFHSFTNPIWLNIPSNTLAVTSEIGLHNIKIVSTGNKLQLNYFLSTNDNVQISVFNTLGQEIACFEKTQLLRGTHSIALPSNIQQSGIYFVRFQTSKGIKVHKFRM